MVQMLVIHLSLLVKMIVLLETFDFLTQKMWSNKKLYSFKQ